MRKPRNLSGIYYRYKNPETEKWENWCIEDIPYIERTKIIEESSDSGKKHLINWLCAVINDVSDQLDIKVEYIEKNA